MFGMLLFPTLEDQEAMEKLHEQLPNRTDIVTAQMPVGCGIQLMVKLEGTAADALEGERAERERQRWRLQSELAAIDRVLESQGTTLGGAGVSADSGGPFRRGVVTRRGAGGAVRCIGRGGGGVGSHGSGGGGGSRGWWSMMAARSSDELFFCVHRLGLDLPEPQLARDVTGSRKSWGHQVHGGADPGRAAAPPSGFS